LIKGYEEYFQFLKSYDFKIFKVLLQKQQLPKTIAVHCCDSRTNTKEIFISSQEELSVFRNTANLTRLENKKNNICANAVTREYTLEDLNVQKITILNYCYCLGLKFYSDGNLITENRKTKFVDKHKWSPILKSYFDSKFKNLKLALKHLVKKILIESVENLKKYLFFRAKVHKEQLTTLDCWFDTRKSELLYLNECNQEFLKYKNIWL